MGVNALLSLFQMVSYTATQGVDVRLRIYANALIHKARNRALGEIRPDATHALFVDDDMIPEQDALCRLLVHQLPIVSAVCTSREHPVRLVARVWDENSHQFLPLETINLSKVISGPFAVGAAFLLIDRASLDKVTEYHISGQDWLDQNQRMLDQLAVRKEKRESYRQRIEEERRGRWQRDKYLTVWDHPIGPDGLQLGEDVAISQKFRRLNIPVAIDGTIWVGHIGEYPYGVWDLIKTEEQETQPGSVLDDPVLGGRLDFNTSILKPHIGKETLPAYMRSKA